MLQCRDRRMGVNVTGFGGFDPRVSACRVLPWTIFLPTLVLIAQAVIPLESGQMQLNAVCRRDWISIHIGPTRLISTKNLWESHRISVST